MRVFTAQCVRYCSVENTIEASFSRKGNLFGAVSERPGKDSWKPKREPIHVRRDLVVLPI